MRIGERTGRLFDSRVFNNVHILSERLWRCCDLGQNHIIRINSQGELFVNGNSIGREYNSGVIASRFHPLDREKRNIFIYCDKTASPNKIAALIRGLAIGDIELVRRVKGVAKVYTQDYSVKELLAHAGVDWIKINPQVELDEKGVETIHGAMYRNPTLEFSLREFHSKWRNAIAEGIINGLLHGVLDSWPNLSQEDRSTLSRQISGVDFQFMKHLVDMHARAIETDGADTSSNITRYKDKIEAVSSDDFIWEERLPEAEISALRTRGEEFLRSGKFTMLLMAAGVATRFGLGTPTAPYKLFSPETTGVALPEGVNGSFSFIASAFADARHFEEVYGRPLPMKILINPLHRALIESHLRKNEFFGVDSANVSFIVQTGMLPRVYRNKANGLFSLALERDSSGDILPRLDMAPSGHGWAVEALQKYMPKGAEIAFVRNIDNLGATVSDPLYAFILGSFLKERENGAQVMVELVKPKGKEPGASPVRFQGKSVLLEGEKFIRPANEAVWNSIVANNTPFNTLTMTVDLKSVAGINRAADLPWFVVPKELERLNDQWPIPQFEQMLGSLTELVNAAYLVPGDRDMRFLPSKKTAEVPWAAQTFVETSAKKGISLAGNGKKKQA